MDRLQFHILLEECGIYSKRKLGKDEAYNPESDLIYKETATSDKYEIIPTDLTTEEINVALLAKQLKMLDKLHTQFAVLIILLLIPFILGFLFLLI